MKMRNVSGWCRWLPVVLMCLFTAPSTSPAVDVGGIIDADSRWTTGDSPVHIVGDLVVASGATLTIDPGVEVVFSPRPDTGRGYHLTVGGTLVARGDASLPIVFTALDPTRPWGSIVFEDSSVDWDDDASTGSILSVCLLEYGGNNPEGGALIVTVDANPRIADNALRFSSGAAIAAFATDIAGTPGGSIQIVGNQIYANPLGVLLDAEGGTVANNYFLNNGRAVRLLTRTSDIDLRGNTIVGASDELFGAGVQVEMDAVDSGIAAYRWIQSGGPAVVLDNPTGARPSFSAPDPGDQVATLTFDLTVTGKNGLTATDSVEVTVVGSNIPPVANAGGDASVPLTAAEVTLNGAGSSDPDDGIGAYLWEQESGAPVTLLQANTARPRFSVPGSVAAGDRMTFKLTVTDNGGLESSDTVDLRFYGANVYPVARPGEPVEAAAGETVNLDGSASSDADGGIAAYSWLQTTGTSVVLVDGATARPHFVAPDVDGSGETLTFDLTVTDTGGLADTKELSVRINGLTAAEPGEDQRVAAGDTVVLDGSASIDREAAGDIGVQSNAIRSDSADAGLIAVTALEDARYTLQCSGNNFSFAETPGHAVYLYDWEHASDSLAMADNWWGTDDPAAIDALLYENADDRQLPAIDYAPFAGQAIEDAGSSLNYPPLAEAGPDIDAGVDMRVSLDGTGSYDPDGIGVYQWRQVAGPSVALQDADQPVASFVAPSGGSEGQELRFSLTVTTGGPFAHTDEAVVTIRPDEPLPTVEVGGGCFIQSALSAQDDSIQRGAMMILLFVAVLCVGGLTCRKGSAFRRRWIGILVMSLMGAAATADAGFFAVGGGGGGEADQYNITFEAGSKEVRLGDVDMMVAVGMPFIPHGDGNLPDTTIAAPCPNNDCQPMDEVRKGTEVGFYGKLGIRLGTSDFYINAIGGFTVFTESRLVRSPGSGYIYEDASDTTIEPLYGGGVSFFPDNLDWPLFIQVDYDVTRGVTGTIGWYW